MRSGRRKPIPIVGFGGVGIACGLRFFDFLAENRQPLALGEQTFLIKRDRRNTIPEV